MKFDDLMPESGDIAILVREGGRRGVAYLRRGGEIHSMPLEVRSDYSQRETDPPLTPRRVTVKAGWSVKDFEAVQ